MIKHETFQTLINNNKEVNKEVISWYATNFRQLYKKLYVIGTKNVHGKFAEALLYLSQNKLIKEDIFKHITRNEIAELAGISVESMLKIMQELKADNIIKVSGKKIEIQDLEMMKRLSRIG